MRASAFVRGLHAISASALVVIAVLATANLLLAGIG
jgi:hypothetical protein